MPRVGTKLNLYASHPSIVQMPAPNNAAAMDDSDCSSQFSMVNAADQNIATPDSSDLVSSDTTAIKDKQDPDSIKKSVSKISQMINNVVLVMQDVTQTPKVAHPIDDVQNIRVMQTIIRKSWINRSLDWAISNASISSFYYATTPQLSVNIPLVFRTDSTEFIKNLLVNFREGVGAVVPNWYAVDSWGLPVDNADEQFRECVVKQVWDLTGIKPRMSVGGSACVIYCP